MRPPYTPRSNWPGYRTLLNEYAIFFPFSIRGMDDPVPTIDFSPTGSIDSTYSLERDDVDRE